jgi:adenosylcobinamide-GDP ribazoletransferase
MIKEFKRLLGCFSYFTRIPVWKIVDTSAIDMKETTKYIPIVGWTVGGLSAMIIYFCNLILPLEISILLSMAVSLILTGAIHEDGFADVCDGFGGGYTRNRILDIMKDSSTGVFGGVGLIMMLSLKFWALLNMPTALLIPVVIIAHSISRWTSISFLFTHEYARKEETSKSTVFIKKPSWTDFMLMSLFAILPFFLLPKQIIPYALVLIIPIFLLKTLLGKYFNKKIGGYTGDCMGATQQLAELFFYLGILIIINNIL